MRGGYSVFVEFFQIFFKMSLFTPAMGGEFLKYVVSPIDRELRFL